MNIFTPGNGESLADSAAPPAAGRGRPSAAVPKPEGRVAIVSGIGTAATVPRAVTTPSADTVASTMIFRGPITEIATGRIKRVHGLNRCPFDLSGRSPKQARLAPATVTRQRLDLLREIDRIVMSALVRHGLMRRRDHEGCHGLRAGGRRRQRRHHEAAGHHRVGVTGSRSNPARPAREPTHPPSTCAWPPLPRPR